MKEKCSIKIYLLWGVLLISLLFLSTSAQATLVAQYHMDDGTGINATDATGNGNTGVLSGATWLQVPGSSNYALSFDGTNDYADCGVGSTLSLTSGVTMIAYVCPWAGQTGTEVGICGKGTPSAPYFLLTYTNNAFKFYINSSATAVTAPVTPGVWNQIAVTYNQTNLKIYVNGNFVAQTAYTTAISANSAVHFDIGSCGTVNYFKGLVDEVQVYNAALTANQVAAQYSSTTQSLYNSMVSWSANSVVCSTLDGLVMHYGCNEGSGTTVHDSSGFVNNGTGASITWPASADGYGLGFNGTASNVNCGSKTGLDLNGPITVSTWIKPNTGMTTERGVAGKSKTTYMLAYNNGKVYWYVNNTSINANLATGSWAQVTATYDKTHMYIYINGSQVATGNLTTAVTSGTTLYLGYEGTAGTYFNGTLDETRIYNRALSGTEVTNLYNEDNTARSGRVAHYKFDEGSGNTTADASGHGNTGTLVGGCKWVACNGGNALHFDGTSAYVDCGAGSSLNITGNTITQVAWVCPDLTQPTAEPGIVGKGEASYLLAYYPPNSGMYSYINSTANQCGPSSAIRAGYWNQIVTTYDGSNIKIYVNGSISATLACTGNIATDPNHLVIGLLNGSSWYFKGYIDEVMVYNTALTSTQVSALFSSTEQSNRNAMFGASVTPMQSITSGNITVKVGAHGGMEVDNGSSYFVWNSNFSYPGTAIGWDTLSEAMPGGEVAWSPTVTKNSSTKITIAASGTYYSLSRVVQLVTRTSGATAVTVQDTLTNLSATDPVGIWVTHNIGTPSVMTNTIPAYGGAQPLMFFSQSASDFGIVAEDDLGRLQFNNTIASDIGWINHPYFGLDKSKSYTFKYAIYPQSATGDVFNVVNPIRKDWGSNVTIQGSFQFLDPSDTGFFSNADNLKQYVQRRNLNIVPLAPSLDDNPSGSSFITRSQYRSLMAGTVPLLKAANPNVKSLGMVETDWIHIDPTNTTDNTQPMFTTSDGQAIMTYCQSGFNPTYEPAAATAIANTVSLGNLRWKDPDTGIYYNFADSIRRTIPGWVDFEYLNWGGPDIYVLAVYPAPNNGQYNYLMEQNAFIMDTCGLDGFYQDDFSQGWGSSIYDYGNSGELQWDGNSVLIDQTTGQITQNLVDCSYVAIQQRVNMMNAASSRGKYMVANTYSTSPEEQTSACNRFSETEYELNPNNLSAGVQPPFDTLCFASCLGTPIGLGCSTYTNGNQDTAQGLMLCVMQLLRHGMVYYNYAYPDLPTSGTGAGQYGPINHMFPITPQELHVGWIKGNERIVTCVSLSNVAWNNSTSYPMVHFFDIHGNEILANGSTRTATVAGSAGNWTVSITLSNWSEFCVIEGSDGTIAHYSFNDDSSNYAIDSSGNGNTAQIFGGANWVPVNGGYCLYFDGGDNYLDCGNNPLLKPSSAITVSAWVAPSAHQPVIQSGIAGTGQSSYLAGYNSSTGNANFFIDGSANKATYAIPANSWSLVTATYDGANIKLYVNGTLQNTHAYTGTIASGGDLLIGCMSASGGVPNAPFKGFVDDVQVWNRTLTSTQVGALFSSSTQTAMNSIFAAYGGQIVDGLVADYKMTEGTGTTTADSSGFGNTATLHHASWLNVGGGTYALDFDGVSNYVDCGNSPSLNITGPITLTAWVCPWATQLDPGGEVGILGKSWNSFLVTLFQNNQMYNYINWNESGAFAGPSTLNPGTWSQIVMTYDGSTLNSYMNGTLTSTAGYSGRLVSDGNLYLGCAGLNGSSPFEPYKGVIGEVKIYDYAMSGTDVAGQFSSTVQTNLNSMLKANGGNVEDSLVAHYDFHEGSGTALSDISGHMNTGSIAGATWTTRKAGVNALNFTSANGNYVNCGVGPSLDIVGPMTTIVWVKPTGIQSSSEAGIVGKGYGNYLLTYFTGDGHGYWYIDSGSNNANYTLSTSAWTQVATTFNGSGGVLNMYINGNQTPVSTTTGSYTSILDSLGMPFYLGYSYSIGNEYFGGKIGEVRIYNRCLSASEIHALYNP